MKVLQSAWIVDAIRTPIGRYGRSLASVRPDDLAAHVIAALAARQPDAITRLDQVIFGATNQAGEDNRNVARMATLLAGLPFEVPAVTVNRLCGSGLESITDAAMRIAVGDADVVVAGGVESMSRAPFSFRKTETAFDRTPPEIFDTTIGWRYPNPKMQDRFSLDSMGMTAENVAAKWAITREEQDAFALDSQMKAKAAIEAGRFADEIVPVEIPQRKGEPLVFAADESPRPTSTMDGLARLKPVFKQGGTVTAGNSSPVNDGAAACLVVSERVVRELGLEPIARVVSFGSAGLHPNVMGEGPIPSTRKALARAGWSIGDLDIVEMNEAFAAQSLACLRGLELDPTVVNVNGGALALGHPIGASGCRIVVTLAHEMRRRSDVSKALATLCIGVGQGLALCLERA